MKIKFKNIEVEDVYQELTEEEADVLLELFPEGKNDYNLKDELEHIAEEVEEEVTQCPECGSSLVHAVLSSNPMGIGETYTQKMRPFTIFYDVVCSKCGLVLKQAVHEVHQ